MKAPIPFHELEAHSAAAILADPPWTFETFSERGKGRSAERHYSCMGIEAIKSLPVAKIAAADSALFLWATNPMLPAALEVVGAWGFCFKTVAFTWIKQNPSGNGWHFGLGYWTRANPELCLLATRGKPKRLSRSVPQLVVAPVMEHSRKPVEVLYRIKQLVPGPYLELFARDDGWTKWGDQAAPPPAEINIPRNY
jgi:N6-adenosine-specific RNA methylase IME4